MENTKWKRKTNKIGSIILAETALLSLLGIYVYAFFYCVCSRGSKAGIFEHTPRAVVLKRKKFKNVCPKFTPSVVIIVRG